MIHLSPAAASEIERLKSKQHSNVLFRLAVKPGGCSGWFYDLSFEPTVNMSDAYSALRLRLFDVNDIQVVIDAESIDFVNGLTLDYTEDLMGGGFRFHNPQALTTCSCGNSFAISH